MFPGRRWNSRDRFELPCDSTPTYSGKMTAATNIVTAIREKAANEVRVMLERKLRRRLLGE